MKMISNQVTTMCIFLAVNCCMIKWTPSGPSVMPSSFIKMDINKEKEGEKIQALPENTPPSSGSNHIMEEMFASLNKLYEERNQAFKEKFGINIMDEQTMSDVLCNPGNLETHVESVTEPTQPKSVSQNTDMMEPQKQAKDIKVREVHEPLFCSGKELTPGAWELIRQSREIYAGRGMIQDSYKQYNSQLAEELRMNHHFSNFTVEKSTGEKRKMAELSLKDFD